MFNSISPTQRRVKIGNKYIGDNEPTFFIAEVGNNHNGDFYLAKRLVEKSVQACADAVKFQKRHISETFTKEMRNRVQTENQVFGKTYGEYREKQELNFEEFKQIKEISERLGTFFFSTGFDHKSVDFLDALGVEAYKIASFDVPNIPLVEHIASKRKPIIMSVGGASIEEMDGAIGAILKYHDQIVLLHCVSIYPTPDHKVNLRTIEFLRDRYYRFPIGYSGHERGISISQASVALGAQCIERHITIDTELPGPDHATVSLEPDEFKNMVEGVRRLEKALGTKDKPLDPEEKQKREKHSKSIVSLVRIPAGTFITVEMLTCKSPGHGLKPTMLNAIAGKRAKSDIDEDVVIGQDDILW